MIVNPAEEVSRTKLVGFTAQGISERGTLTFSAAEVNMEPEWAAVDICSCNFPFFLRLVHLSLTCTYAY